MKRLTALLLSLFLLIPMMTIGISAETVFDPLTDDSLVLHYDFSGDQPYANKASDATDPTLPANGGLTVNSNLIELDTINGTVKNIAKGTGLKTSKDYVGQYMTGTVEYTFFARVKLDSTLTETTGASDIYYNIADMRDTTSGNGYRCFALQYVDRKAGSTSQDAFAIYISSTANRSAAKGFTVPFALEDAKSQYVNLAVVVNNAGTDDAPNYQAKLYYSVGYLVSECLWTESVALDIGADICAANKDMTILSAANSVVLDDMRIYNQPLSKQELSDVVYSGAFAKQGINDYLAIHYDFEGENYLQNKAPYASKGDLKASTNDVIDHDATIGTVTKTDNNKGGLYCSKNDVYDLIAGGLYDANSNTAGKAAEYTIFSRFRLDDMLAGTEYRIIDTRTFGTGTCRPLGVIYKDGKLSLCIGAEAGHSPAWKNIQIAELDAETRFINLALVVYNAAADGVTPKMKMAIYYSQGMPSGASDWTKAVDANINNASGTQSATVSPLNQNLYLLDMNNGKAGVEMDDFRIYTKAFTADEVYGIMSYGSFAPDVVSVGYQQMKQADSYNVRFVGGINTLDYDEVGIEITTTIGDKTSATPVVETSKGVYSSIMADGNTVTAADRYCEHFIAFTVAGIPLDQEIAVEFEYRFFAVKDGVKYYSEYSVAAFNADGTPVV